MGNFVFKGLVLSPSGNMLRASVSECVNDCFQELITNGGTVPFRKNDFHFLLRHCNADGSPTTLAGEHSSTGLNHQTYSFYRSIAAQDDTVDVTACFRFQNGMVPDAEALSNVVRKVQVDGHTEYCLQECYTSPGNLETENREVNVPTFRLTTAPTPAPTPAPEWELILNEGGLCLDVDSHNVLNNGGQVQVWECNGELQQQWRLMEDTGAIVNEGGLCLDADSHNYRSNGGNVQVWECNGQPQQQWRVEQGGAIVNAGGLCLDVHAPDRLSNGGNVQVWDCTGYVQQRWNFN